MAQHEQQTEEKQEGKASTGSGTEPRKMEQAQQQAANEREEERGYQ